MDLLDELLGFTSSKHCNTIIHELIKDKWTLKAACEAVGKKTLRTPESLKKYYQRHGKDQSKEHGLNKLTKEEENILVSIAMVYLSFHKGLTWHELIEIVKNVYNVDLGRQWYLSFMKCHNDSISERKSKLLANKRFDQTFVEHVVEFIAHVEEVAANHKMDEMTTSNYDKTQMLVTADGAVTLEKIGKA